ncbi:hypothetical protein BDY21DRAFT_329753 [Lineolata rhizophorae]|uniref:DUF1330 domain-containing protein n=1 Tax=Lineolata rhizophorae TaxID=578093 RepID=A0A6A6PCZ7_9PEZI|nr:hypothetical protein BDY21DRAFT_329753 [Lineolata rhizophorae]
MPLITIHVLALNHSTNISTFLATIRNRTTLTPLVTSRVVRWIILPRTSRTPSSTAALLASNTHWDILLILPTAEASLPQPLSDLISRKWSVTASIPSRLLKDFASKNEKLLHPTPGSIPSAPSLNSSPAQSGDTGSSQSLELSPELLAWAHSFAQGTGSRAVSMLNLLAFEPGKKESYLQYGKAFAEKVGKKKGGVAKLVGSVVGEGGVGKKDQGEGKEWDEFALAHYPSIEHFVDMLRSGDYQEANRKYRIPALRDTFILCTTEVGLEEESKGMGAKL